MGENTRLAMAGGTVTEITMNYEFNLFGASTVLKGRNYINFPAIEDALVEKEIPIKEESGFSWGKLLGCALAGLAVVAVAAVAVAYVASVVVSGGATLAVAPTLIPAIMGFGTFCGGSIYVLNKTSQDMNNKQNSGYGEYIQEAIIGSTRGMVSAAIYTYIGPASLLNTFGTGFLSGNIGSAIEQLMRKGNIDVVQATIEGTIEGLFAGFIFGLVKGTGAIINKVSKIFKGNTPTPKPKPPTIAEIAKMGGDDFGDDVANQIAKNANGGGSKTKLLEELANSGVKYNPDDVVTITKTPDGNIVWLENGNSNAGLEHIMNHADEFVTKGIPEENISDFVIEALKNGKVVGYQGKGTGRPIYEIVYNRVTQRVAITTGSNGFIVGANPVSIK